MFTHLENISGLFVISPKGEKKKEKNTFATLSRDHTIKNKTGINDTAKNFDAHLYG